MKRTFKLCKCEILMSCCLVASLLFCGVCFRQWYFDFVVPEVETRTSVKVLSSNNISSKPQDITQVQRQSISGNSKQYIYYDIELSQELQEHTQTVCSAYDVPFELALSVMWVESRYKPDVANGQCVGLFQINLDYANAYFEALEISDIKQPKDNILSGVWYLSELMAKYKDLNLVLMHYNLGNKADKLWNEGIRETKYTNDVINAEIELVRVMR